VCETAAAGAGSGCAAAGGAGAGGLALLVLLGLLGRRRPGVLLGLLGLGACGLAACSSPATTPATVCHTRDAGAAEDAASVADAAADARPASDAACRGLRDLVAPDACGPGATCDLADFVSGAVGCRPTGTTAAYAPCSGATPDCVAGASCLGLKPTTYACLPLCDVRAPACPGGGVCLVLTDVMGAADVGYCLPAADCDLLTNVGCTPDYYGVFSCTLVDGTRVCLPPGNTPNGQPCQADADCLRGAGCRANGRCASWCRVTDGGASGCVAPATCQGVGQIPAAPDVGHCE
jgi:hypothetical protein